MRSRWPLGVWTLAMVGCARLGYAPGSDARVETVTPTDSQRDAPLDISDGVALPDGPHDHGPALELAALDGPRRDARRDGGRDQPPLPPKDGAPKDKPPVKDKPPPGKDLLPGKDLPAKDGPPKDGPPCPSAIEICDGKDNNCNTIIDESCLAPWWDTTYTGRYHIRLTNTGTTARTDEPVFVSGAQLTGGATPIKESSLRVVRWTGSANQEIPFALHDWTAGNTSLEDADGDFDANDELLFLAAVGASSTGDYYVYYDTVDHTPAAHSKIGIASGGAGFPRVTVDGTTAAADYLRFTDGAALFDLMLVDSIPFWNHTTFFTYESSAIGPRLNDLTLPDGTKVFSTVNHTTGSPAGMLVHTLRLGPQRLDGGFNILASENPFFQGRLVGSNAHSAVQAFSRPLAAVVVIDAELYCDEAKNCDPPRDHGDVQLVGYLFNRGSANEALMRWKVSAAMDKQHTIQPNTNQSYSEEYSLATYYIEGYTEKQFPGVIDIDTFRVRDLGGAVTSTQFDTTAADVHTCKDTDSWAMMSDTDAPHGGAVALLVEGSPVLNGAAASWRGCAYNDGPGALELNGFQSEWHLSPLAFKSWGSGASDTASYSYWVYAYPHPATGNDYDPATAAASWVRGPLGRSVSYESRKLITGL